MISDMQGGPGLKYLRFHKRGATTAATMFHLLAVTRMHEIEPWARLKGVLERIPIVTPPHLHELLPDVWAKAHLQHHLSLVGEATGEGKTGGDGIGRTLTHVGIGRGAAARGGLAARGRSQCA